MGGHFGTNKTLLLEWCVSKLRQSLQILRFMGSAKKKHRKNRNPAPILPNSVEGPSDRVSIGILGPFVETAKGNK